MPYQYDEGKSHMTISIDRDKTFDKIQQSINQEQKETMSIQ